MTCSDNKDGQRQRKTQGRTGSNIRKGTKKHKVEENVGPKNTQVMQFTWYKSQRRAQRYVGPKYTQAQMIWCAKVDDKWKPKYMQNSQRIRRAPKSTWAKIMEK
ncbi:hypothetical protein DFH28DRAFT_931619 [Melampsora americana]|nr:hypothetical protein DFH28DRAFT_931619 [Melampsora americana]